MVSVLAANHLLAASVVQSAGQRVAASWPWYIVRAAGFTAAGLLILLMLSGIFQVTGLMYRFLEPVKAWAVHKALAIALCFAIVIHVGFLLIDHYVRFSIWQVSIPFLSHYSNGSKLFGLSGVAVAFGILAAYGVALLVASSLGWIDSKKGLWRTLHYASYAVIILAFIHALGVGTDLRYGSFRAAWLAVGVVLVLAVLGRLWRAGTMHKKKDAE
jgi:methionine sulfoxide reductase heme-binding subunit